MENIRVDLSISQGIELLLNHYKYGMDYNSSIVLVDASSHIIGFHNHNTPTIDVIMCENIHKGNFIISDGVGVNTNKLYKYSNYDYYEVYKKVKPGTPEAIIEIEKMKEFNTNYFNNLLKEIGE